MENINPETKLDAVTFSDEEDNNFQLDEQTYQKEMKKIESLYSNNVNNANNEDDDGTMNTYTCTKHEKTEKELKELPVPYALTPSDTFTSCGAITSTVEDRILVAPTPHSKIIDLDNIIYNKNKICIGYLDDVIGNIDKPVYVVRKYPTMEPENIKIEVGEEVFYADNYVKFVDMLNINMKGCDASNAFDEEVSEGEMDYSDDEEEIRAKAERKKNKKRKLVETNKIINPEYTKEASQQSSGNQIVEEFNAIMTNAMNVNPFANPMQVEGTNNDTIKN